MAPISKENALDGQRSEYSNLEVDGDTIVVTGFSALLPGCRNVDEFSQKLYNKENLILDEEARWQYNHPELQKYYGKIPDLDRFDAQFFMINYMLCMNLDVLSRKLMEQAYQAIFDAGVSPPEIHGKQVGVYISTCFSETDKVATYANNNMGLLGTNKAMYANRISYMLNLKGPSMVLDASSAGSMIALERACSAIMSGECEAAFVGGSKILLHPQSCILQSRVCGHSSDGITKCYSENADGQACSEGINVIYLQKLKDAKRVYAAIRHVSTSYKMQSDLDTSSCDVVYRHPILFANYLQQFYEEARIPPSLVEYVEGAGAAFPDADKAELEALESIFCKGRSKPLLVGSVTSNLGYTEAASVGNSIIKVLLAYQRGEIAATINCEEPRKDIKAIKDGHMKIVIDHQTFERTFTAINTMSCTGLNGHALLQGVLKAKDKSIPACDYPFLITLSGRQEKSVQKIINDLKSRPINPEEIGLLHSFYRKRIARHMGMGYCILGLSQDNKTISMKESVSHNDNAKRPLWFVYSGMGSQWAGMGAKLMRMPIFAASIHRSHKVLESKGLDLIQIITSPDPKIFDNILNSFVGIAAIQIALTDVLKSIGLIPDNIIGHSVGELGCAYADGCLTAEQMILSAYSRGLVSIQTTLIRGSMAAVGLGFKQISKMCPPEIDVACHNGPESCTISGPAEKMTEFVAQLTAKGIFAKEVPCSNIAYHSQYIADAGPGLLKYLSEVITKPEHRSLRWLSTSIPQDEWTKPSSLLCSAEYHTNNLLSPVLFEETSKLIPSNAVLIEIAPHGLLQAILKRSLPSTCSNIPLTRRDHQDNLVVLLEGIGKIYTEGYDINVSALYPKIEFPVSTETRSLSHLVEWDYSESWNLAIFEVAQKEQSLIYTPVVAVQDDDYNYLKEHVIDGRRVLPFAAVLVFVWDTLAMAVGKNRGGASVQFKNINLYQQPLLQEFDPLRLIVTIQKGSGRFEVTNEQVLVADGFVVSADKLKVYDVKYTRIQSKLSESDIYKVLYENGCLYSGLFRNIKEVSCDFTSAEISWRNNWVAFISGLFQLSMLRLINNLELSGMSDPYFIKRITINPTKHMNDIKPDGNITVHYLKNHDVMSCGGIVIEHVNFKTKPLSLQKQIGLKAHKFVPFHQNNQMKMTTSLYLMLQIVSENLTKDVIKVFDLVANKDSLLDKIKDLLKSPPEIQLEVTKVSKDLIERPTVKTDKPDVILIYDMFVNPDIRDALRQVLPNNVYLISCGIDTSNILPDNEYRVIASSGERKEKIDLAKWKPHKVVATTATIAIRNNADLELLHTTVCNLPPKHKLFVLAPYPPLPGIKDLLRLLKQKISSNSQLFLIMTNQKQIKESLVEILNEFGLSVNVLYNGVWGGDYYVPIEDTVRLSHSSSLQSSCIGNIHSLEWVHSPKENKIGIAVDVHYAGLNTFDVKKATGKLCITNDSSFDGFGMDFSGITQSGAKVMGLIKSGSASKQVRAKPEMLWPVPSNWSLEDAATVPYAYIYAFYCYFIRTNLQRGMTVLVHGATGALGQAAVSVALAMGCMVFATVGDIQKKRILRKLFPDLPVDHIGNSRDGSFKDMILIKTKTRGCDIIISCVKGELKNATLSCVGRYGVTIDTNQIQSTESFECGMNYIDMSRSYFPVDFSSIFIEENYNERLKLRDMLADGIAQGFVRPLSRVVYEAQDVHRGFRVLANSCHRGRVLLRLQDTLPTKPRLTCSAEGSHLVLCDNNVDLGVQLSNLLVKRGAKNILIHCTSPSSFLNYKTRTWTNYGVNIKTFTKPLHKFEDVSQLVDDCNAISKLEGIYLMAMKQNNIKMSSLIETLDLTSRQHCRTLKYFLVVSDDFSVSSLSPLSRSNLGLPNSIVYISKLNEFPDNTDQKTFTWREAIDSIEIALCTKDNRVLPFMKIVKEFTIVEELQNFAGVDLENKSNSAKTLRQIGIKEEQTFDLCQYLRDKFNIIIATETILDMSLSSLQQLRQHKTLIPETVGGLKAYINFIEKNEIECCRGAVSMKTLVNNGEMRSNEFGIDHEYLFIVPGIDGNDSRFNLLCERLKISAVVLLLDVDKPNETVVETAQRLVNAMEKKFKVSNSNHFYILGYEYGVLVCLEMASILEKRGLNGTIYCLGGTPNDVKDCFELDLSNMDDQIVQNSLITNIFGLITGNSSNDLSLFLENSMSWEVKLNICIKFISKQIGVSTGYIRNVIESAYNRLQIIRTYGMTSKVLKSEVVLIRSSTLNVKSKEFFSGFFQQTPVVHHLTSTLSRLPKDMNCPNIINKYLQKCIIESYEKLNLCQKYFINRQQTISITSD